MSQCPNPSIIFTQILISEQKIHSHTKLRMRAIINQTEKDFQCIISHVCIRSIHHDEGAI